MKRGVDHVQGSGGCRLSGAWLVIWLMMSWGVLPEVQGQAAGGVPNTDLVGTPQELLQAGDAAYQGRDWKVAAEKFELFLSTYGAAPEMMEMVVKVKPLLALCKIRLQDYGGAGALITECLTFPDLEPALRDEFAFWKGVILLQVQAYDEARQAFIAYYQTPEFQQARRVESILLYGTTYVLEDNHQEAADFFGQQASRLWDLDHEAALRAQTLRLNSLLELDDLAGAMELVATLQPLMDEVTQIISLHGLTADLGGRFLDGGDFYSAIFCLQRVWPAERLLRHQGLRMEELKREVETLAVRPGAQAILFAKKNVLTRVEREYGAFGGNVDFDLGVRMRLGFAYLGLERWREAALVLEDALKLPGDPGQQSQAGLAVVQCWLQIKRYDRCVAAADSWLARFDGKVEEDVAARVRFLMAQALYDDQEFVEAAKVFEEMTVKHEKHELSPEALLMAGLGRLMADEHDEAVRLLTEVVKRHAKLPVAEDADYWYGMALSFNGEYEACREHLGRHLKAYAKSGKYRAPAVFRRAYCLFSAGEYEGAISEFTEYLREYPESPDVAEARVLKGDTLASLGEIDEAITSYLEVEGGTRHWYDEAQFKVGKILKLRRDYAGLLAHFEAFIKDYPGSGRLAEAVYWCGVALIEQDQLEDARKLYWEAVNRHGNEAGHFGVEDILLALPKLYRGEENRLEMLREIQRQRAVADKAEKKVLVCRLSWMEGHAQPKDRPKLAQADFLLAAQHLDVKRMNPRVTLDCADALRAAGSKLRSGELYAELIKWYPRAVEVERAMAGLGFLAEESGDWEVALDWYGRYEKRAVTPDLAEEVALRKAALFAEHRRADEAVAVYQQMLENKLTSGRGKALALLAWGRLLEEQRKLLPATAYYERVYLAYAKHGDLAAQAYLARGRALESLGRKGDAAEVYVELRSMEALAGFPEYEEAALRLKVTGPPPLRVEEKEEGADGDGVSGEQKGGDV
jgi:TolA-binding protein